MHQKKISPATAEGGASSSYPRTMDVRPLRYPTADLYKVCVRDNRPG